MRCNGVLSGPQNERAQWQQESPCKRVRWEKQSVGDAHVNTRGAARCENPINDGSGLRVRVEEALALDSALDGGYAPGLEAVALMDEKAVAGLDTRRLDGVGPDGDCPIPPFFWTCTRCPGVNVRFLLVPSSVMRHASASGRTQAPWGGRGISAKKTFKNIEKESFSYLFYNTMLQF